ncbi:MAG TPA: universal stress protein [Bacteroidia bacterium]|jgi:nucleotide-binding universal stress UspA family protein|nr:universal stress protein [Bacteroidia bacterium]
MKTILVPVDFSSTAENAAEYAAEFAKYLKAKLILLHVYSVPVPVADVPITTIIPLEEIEKENIKRLKAFNKTLNHKYPGIETEMITRIGFVVEEILMMIEERNSDLVIMGLSGESKAKGIFGSNTTTVIKKAKCPVLTIPPGLKFKKPEKIALACDYSAIVPDEVVNKFKEYVSLFGAKVLVFDVLRRAELVTYQKAAAEVNLENSLVDVGHSLYYPSGDNLPEEANSFIERQNADMLVMIPHNYTFFQSLFHRSATKQMAFQSKVPLLTIHE